MSDWTAGYVTDVGYTFGYYEELNPLRSRLSLINAGFSFPQTLNACELGFGQGVSVNLHAAASGTSWFGTDFNPSQAAFAQDLAISAQSDAKLYDQSFTDFCSRTDLPDFDYISLHGIWSWISDENRSVIVDFVARKLRVGGVLYISYNTLPGWAAMAPTRELMAQHASIMGRPGSNIIQKVDEALSFVDQLFSASPLYAKANPQVDKRFEAIKKQNKQYLAHEYFNRDWKPMYFTDMARWLEPAKVSFACSANYHDNVDALCLNDDQVKILNGITDVTLRQLIRDFWINQQFRKDYWIKGLRQLPLFDRSDLIREQRVLCTTERADVSLKISSLRGECTLSEAIYAPILDLICDHRIRTIGEIEIALKGKGITLQQVVQSLIVLCGSKHVIQTQDDAAITKSKKSSARLNQHLIKMARNNNDIQSLASPVSGGGIGVSRFDQLFLLAMSSGKKDPPELALFVWNIFAQQGQKILKDGKALETPEENISELKQKADAFLQNTLPKLKILGVV